MKGMLKRNFRNLFVSFVLLMILASCGMPTLFYLNSTDYQVRGENLTPSSINGTLKITSYQHETTQTLLQSSTQGPTLKLFYTITDNDLTVDNHNSQIINLFRSKIKKEPYGTTGIAVQDVVRITDSGKDLALYEFTSSGATPFSLTAVLGDFSRPQLDMSFTLTTNQLSEGNLYTINFTVDSLEPSLATTVTATTAELTGYEGKPFNLVQVDRSNDYSYLSTGTDTLTIHVYAAFVIAGDFTNIFYSDLVNLGKFDLTST